MNGNPDTTTAHPTYQSISQWSERVWMMLIGMLLLNSVLRGISPPNLWAYSHFLVNYDFGFAKRSLQGAVVSAFDIPVLYTYSFAFWYMTGLFVANALLLLRLMRLLCAAGDITSRLTASVFASSLAVVVLAHVVGYGDQVGLLITLWALLVRNFDRRCILVAVLFPVCILVQETQFLLFFPLIVFRFLIDLGDEVTMRHRRSVALGLVFACVFVTLLILMSTRMDEASATAMIQSIQSKADCPLLEYQVNLTKTLADHLRMTIHQYSFPWMQRYMLFCWVVTLPTAAYLMRRTWSQMTHNGYSKFLRAVAMAASVAPLAMHVIAVDGNRFSAFAVITSFLVYATIRLQGGGAHESPSASRPNLFIPAALIAMNLTSSIPLFPGYEVRSFPYEELLLGLGEAVAKGSFPPHPEQCGGG